MILTQRRSNDEIIYKRIVVKLFKLYESTFFHFGQFYDLSLKKLYNYCGWTVTVLGLIKWNCDFMSLLSRPQNIYNKIKI